MRLQTLSLDFFGHFSDKHFEFSRSDDTSSDFHVIYGPNEAGKTTVMEAYLRLLYGFPIVEPYQFKHQRKNLRVSATLEIDGQLKSFVRLPKRGASLLDDADRALPEAALQMHLYGLSEKDYRNLLCLDDHTIEKGGEEIVNSEGDIGTLLFSAAAGISDLSAVLDGVRNEANNLYKPRASKTELAILKSEIDGLDKKIKSLDVPVSIYRKLKADYDQALKYEKQLESERAQLVEQKLVSESLMEALPQIAELSQLEQKLIGCENYPQLNNINPESIDELRETHATAHDNQERLQKELDQLQEQIDHLVFEPAHIALSDRLLALDTLKARFSTSELDLVDKTRVASELQRQMELLAHGIDPDAKPEPVNLVLSDAAMNTIESLLEENRRALSALERETKEIDALRTQLETADDLINSLQKNAPAGEGIRAVLERFDAEDLSRRYSAAQQLINQAEIHCQRMLSDLSVPGQVFDHVPDSCVFIEELEQTVLKWQELGQRIDTLTDQKNQSHIELSLIKARVEKVAQGAESSEARLDDLHSERERLWSSHKIELNRDTAEAFETAMYQLDRALRMQFSQATERGVLQQLEQTIGESQAKFLKEEHRHSELLAEKSAIEDSLRKISKRLGFREPPGPTQLLNWERKRKLAADANEELIRLRKEHRSTFEQSNKLLTALKDNIERESSELQDLIASARAVDLHFQNHCEQIDAAQAEHDRLNREIGRRLEKQTLAQNDVFSVIEKLKDQISRNLSPSLSVESLEGSIQSLKKLRELDRERRAANESIREMEQVQTHFRQTIGDLVAEFGLPTNELPLPAYNRLDQLCRTAQSASDNIDQLQKSVAQKKVQLEKTQQTLRDIELKVDQMVQQFPESVDTSSLIKLSKAINKSVEVNAWRRQKTELEKQLLLGLNCDSIEEVRERLEGLSIVELKKRLSELDLQLTTLDEQYKQSNEQLGAARQALVSIDGDAEVARLVEDKSTLEIQMGELALRYLKLHVGHQLAEEAIRRYRDQHRSGMLRSTEAAFTELTHNKYTRLTTQTDGSSELLQAVDRDGSVKGVQDMSKGTRFQLYLALRAAAYEQLAEQGNHLPFICDDVFETFDEDRTRSACDLMQRIGRIGQAIYLTHHQHVVQIALHQCGDNVHVHQLL